MKNPIGLTRRCCDHDSVNGRFISVRAQSFSFELSCQWL